MKRRSIARWLPAVVAVAVAMWWVSGAGVLAIVRQSQPLPLAAAMLCQVCAALVLGLRWREALIGVGADPIPNRRAATVLSLRAQAAILMAPGGVGADVLRAIEAGYERPMLARLARVAIVERVGGALVLGLIGSAGVMLGLQFHGGWQLWLPVGAVAALVLLGGVKIARGYSWAARVLAWTVANQLLVVGALSLALIATGVRASAPAVLALAAVATAAAMAPVTVSGYGVRELALAFLAPRLGLDGKFVVAAALVASTALLASLVAAALAARVIPTGTMFPEVSVAPVPGETS